MGFRFVPRGLFRAADRYVRRWHKMEHAMRGLSRPANQHDPCLSDPPTKGVLGYRPLGTKPRPPGPPPSKKKEDRYGDGNTIHHTNTVDVEVGPNGEVCAVWFRCRMIPFTSNRVIDSRASDMLETPPESLPGIKAIVFDTRGG